MQGVIFIAKIMLDFWHGCDRMVTMDNLITLLIGLWLGLAILTIGLYILERK